MTWSRHDGFAFHPDMDVGIFGLNCQNVLGSSVSFLIRTGDSLPGVKRPESEADSSPVSSSDTLNVWRFTPSSSIHLHSLVLIYIGNVLPTILLFKLFSFLLSHILFWLFSFSVESGECPESGILSNVGHENCGEVTSLILPDVASRRTSKVSD
jgi:hypothetical protein